MKGFSVYMTREEYHAICDCVELHSSCQEAASLEFVEKEKPITEAAASFIDKCMKASRHR